MAYLRIKNKKDFVNNFIGPVSNLHNMCVFHLSKDEINCIVASEDSTIVCRTSIEVESDVEGSVTLNIPDIKKLHRVLDIIPKEDIKLKINENNISYNESGFKFKYHLLDDGIIREPNININKINDLEFSSTFAVKESSLATVFKGSSFTTETSKLYLYTEDGNIVGELGDRSRHNTDNFICVMSEDCEGSGITTPLALNFESFRLISFNNSREVRFRVNQDMGVITCDMKKNNTSLIYVISALIN